MPGAPTFRTRTVRLTPGEVRPHDEDEWRGALIVVDSGEIELRCSAGGSRTFGAGSVLWFTGLNLVSVRNPGTGDAVFRGITRVAA
nr:cupin domain-containing protein [Pseudonocardia sp. C8]